MDAKQDQPKTVDEYIERCPLEVQDILRQIRAVIREAAPQAEERISYQMPGYFLNGQLVWFAAFKRHIGLYPRTDAMNEAFRDELAAYKGSKGTVQLPLDKPIPYDLIRRIVEFRVSENLARKGR